MAEREEREVGRGEENPMHAVHGRRLGTVHAAYNRRRPRGNRRRVAHGLQSSCEASMQELGVRVGSVWIQIGNEIGA